MADNLGPMAWLFLPENVQVQYLQKIALRAENLSSPKYISITLRIEQIYRIGIWSERDNSPEGARRPQTGLLAPGDGFPHTRKPCKGDKSLSCLQHSFVGAWYNGGCSLRSRPREVHPRLWSDQPFRLRLGRTKFDTIWVYFLPLTNKFCCLFSLVR